MLCPVNQSLTAWFPVLQGKEEPTYIKHLAHGLASAMSPPQGIFLYFTSYSDILPLSSITPAKSKPKRVTQTMNTVDTNGISVTGARSHLPPSDYIREKTGHFVPPYHK